MPLLAVNHHYFREHSTGSGIYPVGEKLLRERVSRIASRYRIVDERMLLAILSDAELVADPCCMLTFDDGLKEQMAAIKALEGLGFAAVCFVPTEPLEKRIVLDVHKLHMIRSIKNDAELCAMLDRRFGFSNVEIDIEAMRAQYRYDSDEGRKVKYFLNFTLSVTEREAWLKQTFEELFGPEHAASESLYMNADDLRELGRKGMLGTHGHRHLPLAGLAANELVFEIRHSMDVLESLSGCSIRGISYPYGGATSVSQAVFTAANECGLEYGFTMSRGVNEETQANDWFSLKRIDTNDIEQYL